jgi:hypothetical protein
MGKTAERALQELHLTFSNNNMAASVAVRDRADENLFFLGCYQRDKNDAYADHTETKIFAALIKAYGNQLEKLPNQATVVISANWSPCKQCTEKTIPGFIEYTKFFDQGNRVLKFRFKRYYTETNWVSVGNKVHPHQNAKKLYWEDNDTAEDAYNDLAEKYGVHKTASLGISLWWKDCYRLVFAPTNDKKTHRRREPKFSDYGRSVISFSDDDSV